MVDEMIIGCVSRYLNRLKERGLDVEFGVIYGSYAQARADQMSDIDVVVVSPIFDGRKSRRDIDLLWHVAAKTDNRIEPVPCGLRQWQEDDASMIVEMARREGQKVIL
ncbi:MAG TPA: nucleotidyltransferase domain-containing protein [Smithellaceae bacterium]|nr:nucleotidyltransferase domain-containing protein [Smithellaceae bacterium]HRV45276.1 nucleotidyltransferase domain-containing protein [Smithellaceae bacterium]